MRRPPRDTEQTFLREGQFPNLSTLTPLADRAGHIPCVPRFNCAVERARCPVTAARTGVEADRLDRAHMRKNADMWLGRCRRPETDDAVLLPDRYQTGVHVLRQAGRCSCFRAMLGDDFPDRRIMIYENAWIALW